MISNISEYNQVALYGAGNHTQRLLNYMRDINREKNVCCIVTLEGGGELAGIPIVKLEKAISNYNIDAIVISSKVYEEVIYDRLKNNDLIDVPIIKIYNGELQETERSYSYYDKEGEFHSTVPMDHIQRYGWAQGFVINKDVVDMACGSGYGTHWMSMYAKSVVGIDISEEAIEHANKWHKTDNNRFICSDIINADVNIMADVVVSFETIEHIADEKGYLKKIQQILKPEGLFLVSTELNTGYTGISPIISMFFEFAYCFSSIHCLYTIYCKNK